MNFTNEQLEERNQRMYNLSMMIVDGTQLAKMDHVGTINVNNIVQLNIYRRYNNPYEMILEDQNLNMHVFKDTTVRDTLANCLNMPYWEQYNMHVTKLYSLKMNASISPENILDREWSDIQDIHVMIRLDIHVNLMNYQIEQQLPQIPVPKVQQVEAHPYIQIPEPVNEFIQAESDRPENSMKNTRARKRKHEEVESFFNPRRSKRLRKE